MEKELKNFTVEEVINDPRKLMIMDALVYDCTEYCRRHPGGARIIEIYCNTNKDAYVSFCMLHRTSRGPLMLKDLIVGRITDPHNLKVEKPPASDDWRKGPYDNMCDIVQKCTEQFKE